jgi:short-subunit dehydrogenase
VNLIAPIELTTLLLPSLRAARGAVVNVASVAGLLGTARAPVYSATKFGLSGWSEALHARLHDEGVRVACVHPGPVPTPGWPHSRVMSSRWSRWLAAPPETIAETIVRASEPGGPLTPIRPRVYRLVSITRATIPPLGRALARSTRSFTSD